jgi:hypothetical protein
MQFENYHIANYYSDNDRATIHSLIKQIPRICKMIDCPLPLRVKFQDTYYYLGAFVHDTHFIHIDIHNIQRAHNVDWPWWKRERRVLRPYKPDLFIHTLAHELAHWKQYCDGDLTNVLMDGQSRSIWKGKLQPILETQTQKTYPRSHHDLPQERDANSWARYVIKELHREKYLYGC